jgi:hypothetical protein
VKGRLHSDTVSENVRYKLRVLIRDKNVVDCTMLRSVASLDGQLCTYGLKSEVRPKIVGLTKLKPAKSIKSTHLV